MKILVFADMRSPHARGWVAGLESIGLEVRSLSSIGDGDALAGEGGRGRLSRMKASLPDWVGQTALTMEAILRYPSRRRRLQKEVRSFRPDIVHALRVSHEGVTALSALKRSKVPVAVSVWGIDFSVQANSSWLLRRWMRFSLPRASGIHVDSMDDFSRARDLGAPSSAPELFAAGNFGAAVPENPPEKSELILAPRGFASRMKTGVMLEGLSLYIQQYNFRGEVVFLDAADVPAVRNLAALHPEVKVVARPRISHDEYMDYALRSRVVLSPAIRDGMPVTVLDALASGSVPVVFDIPSLVQLQRQAPSVQVLPLDASPDEYCAAIVAAMHQSRSVADVRLPQAYSRLANRKRVSAFYSAVLAAQA